MSQRENIEVNLCQNRPQLQYSCVNATLHVALQLRLATTGELIILYGYMHTNIQLFVLILRKTVFQLSHFHGSTVIPFFFFLRFYRYFALFHTHKKMTRLFQLG